MMPMFYFWQHLWLGKMALGVWKWAKLSLLLSSRSQTSLAREQGQVHSHGENGSSLSFGSHPERMVLAFVAVTEASQTTVWRDVEGQWVGTLAALRLFRAAAEAPGDHLAQSGALTPCFSGASFSWTESTHQWRPQISAGCAVNSEISLRTGTMWSLLWKSDNKRGVIFETMGHNLLATMKVPEKMLSNIQCPSMMHRILSFLVSFLGPGGGGVVVDSRQVSCSASQIQNSYSSCF